MSIVACFSVPIDSFCLGEALESIPDASAELDRVVAHSPDHVMPFVWIRNTHREAFDAALADDPTVEDWEVTDSLEGAYLYQFDWTDTVSDRLHVILDHEGVILEAEGFANKWSLWVRFGTRDHLTEFQDHFEQFGEITLHEITTPKIPAGSQYGVSDKQREALIAAYDAGYYDSPSTATGEEVAQELEITQQSLSRRTRRGIKRLIENTLLRHRDN
jgi:predicted DNA binding protein